jgi:hypothetical protein
MYILLKILTFPTAERLWALKPDFHCGWEKKREFALFFFRARRFRFFRAFFSSRFRALFWLRTREREKSAGAHLCFLMDNGSCAQLWLKVKLSCDIFSFSIKQIVSISSACIF